MKQKIILDNRFLYKDTNEIPLKYQEYKLLKCLSDNLLHSKAQLIRKIGMKRTLNEKGNLAKHIFEIKKKTGLNIKTLKGVGYYLEDQIYVI